MQNSSDRIIYFSIGSNTGDREKNIADAFLHLQNHFDDLETASLYETRPLYYKEQPDFINTVFRGILKHSEVSPESVLKLISRIEQLLGRKRDSKIPKGPRIIDIDILLFGNEIIRTENLTIPHAGIYERLFVLVPLLELEKNLIDPVSLLKFEEIAGKLHDQGVYLYQSCRYIEKYITTG
jgi:2-amino-4-hydroxy-6-hydroxymethyldihydropteridine diphosphokinase